MGTYTSARLSSYEKESAVFEIQRGTNYFWKQFLSH